MLIKQYFNQLQFISYSIKMAKVLSELSSNLNRSLEKAYIHKQPRQKNITKEMIYLKQIIKSKDDEILRLKNLIPTIKHQINYQRTALTTQSDYDSTEQIQAKYLHLPSFGTNNKEQLEIMKEKYTQSCNIIAQLQGKIRVLINSSKSTQQQLKDQIEILREDLKYIKEQHDRVTDSLRIQMEHRQSERIKLVQNKYRQQIDLLNEQIASIKRDNSEKSTQITRLVQKIKKQRANNQNNCKFIENKNSELSAKLQYLCLQSKQQVRKREEALIAHFQQDLQHLHKQQAGQIKILCDRIRMLKSLLQEKDIQIKQKTRNQNEATYIAQGEKQQIMRKPINLSTIDKYLKH